MINKQLMIQNTNYLKKTKDKWYSTKGKKASLKIKNSDK